MSVTVRRTFVVGIGLVGMLLAAISVAWACTGNGYINSVSPSTTVEPGSVITVGGAGFQAEVGVELRWAAADGPVLATPTTTVDRTFSASVTVPQDAPAGRHLLFAISTNTWPNVDRAAIPLEVLGEEPPPAPDPEPAPVNTAPVPEPEPAPVNTAPVPDPEPAPVNTAPVPDPEPAPVNTAPEPDPVPAPVAAAQPPTADRATPPVQVPASAPARQGAPAPSSTADQGAAAPAAAPARGHSDAEPAPRPVSVVPAALTNGVVSVPSPDPARVPAALTNGVAPATMPTAILAGDTESPWSPSSAHAPAVATAERSGYEWAGVPESGGATPGVGAGLGLLAGGLVLLFAGFTVAALTKRRVKAKVTGR